MPSPEQVMELESDLRGFIAGRAGDRLTAPLSSYKRQYGGFGVGRDSMIYVNLWLPRRKDPSEFWHRLPVNVCDGGEAFFGVVYDFHQRRFTRIDFNGHV
jgi:hypothetical protein